MNAIPGVRDATPADYDTLIAKGLDSRFLDSGELQVVVANNADAGYATFLARGDGILPMLGEIKTRTPNRRLFYRLIARAVDVLIAAGNERGDFDVKDPRLVALIERDFDVVVQWIGHNVKTGKAGYAHIEVDLLDARRQLARRIQ